jgi:predicted SAM-dependent methyltransferase
MERENKAGGTGRLIPSTTPDSLRSEAFSKPNAAISVNSLLRHHDREFVVNAYREILGREPEPLGLDYYLSSLRTGRLSKLEALGRLRFSPEGQARKVKIRGLLLPLSLQMLRHAPRSAVHFIRAKRRAPSAPPNQTDLILQEHLSTILNKLSEFGADINVLRGLPAGLREARRSERVMREALSTLDEQVRHLRASDAGVELTRMTARLHDLESAVSSVDELRKQVEHLNNHVTHFLEVERAEALSGVQRTPSKNNSDGIVTSKIPRLLNHGKLLAMGPNLRLNLDCGANVLGDYLNIDQRELPGVDLLADIRNLPFEADSVAEIYSAHTIEHFTETELSDKILPYWRKLLRKNGQLRLVTADAEAMIEAFSRGTYPFQKLRRVTFGGQDHDGDFHLNMFSRESLRSLLNDQGFLVGDYIALGRPNGDCLEMELIASKAETDS